MPVFEYLCEECGLRFEHHANAPARADELSCPKGHHKVRRVYSAPSVIYRGSGWYSKDSAGTKK
ncbi:MAG: FmdB family zinc ribbon protein [Anaerolineaceae bacterium]|jgi:putative FmdB family regulatory protein